MKSLRTTGTGSAVFCALLMGATVGCGDAATDDGSGGRSGPDLGSSTTGGGSGLGSGGNDSNLGTGGADASTGGASSGAGGTIINATCPGDSQDAYMGTVAELPGTIEAENFDTTGFSDGSVGNEGSSYRTDVDVDIKAIDGGYAIGWMTSGEWLEYTVNVPSEGDYNVSFEAGAVGTGRTLEVSSCGTTLGTADIANVADWGQMEPSAPITVHLTAGVQVLRITVGAVDYVDLDSITIAAGAASPGGTGGSDGSGGTAGTGGAGTGGASSVGKFVGNITTGYQGSMDTAGRIYSDYWDQVTPENAGKWGSVQSSAGAQFNWSTLDAIYDYTESKGIIFKQHVFVWGAQQPSGNLTEADVKNWMNTFCARYPNTKLIDVVNEPPPHTTPSYANNIGGGTNGNWQWITNAFKWARAACPNAILILNDYNNIEYQNQTQHFIDIVKAIQAAGAPIDAIGAQAHGLSSAISTATMKQLITKMHDDTGLPVYVTEYDIDLADDNAQLTKYKEHMPFFMETEWIHGVTIWGWIHGQTWVPDSGLIKNGQPRPAMTWLMDQLNRKTP